MFVFSMFNEDDAYGYVANIGMFELYALDGILHLKVKDEEFTLNEIGEVHRFKQDATLWIKSIGESRIRITVNDGVKILRGGLYIAPEDSKTDAEKVWLDIQNYYLSANTSDESLSTLLDRIEEHMEKIDETNPNEEQKLNHIFNLIEERGFISALSATAKLVESLENQAPETPLFKNTPIYD